MAGRISRQPGDDPDTIHWRGDQREDLPSRLSDIPEAYRHTPPPIPTSETRRIDPCRWADSPALHLAVGVETMVVGQLDSPSFGQGVPLVAGHWAPGETGIGRDNISRVNGGSARRPVRS